MSQLVSSPLSIGQVLKVGFRLFRQSVGHLLPLTVLAAGLGALPDLIYPGFTPGKPDIHILWGFLAVIPFTTLLAVAVIFKLDDIAEKKFQITTAGSLKPAVKLFFPVLLSSLVYGALTAIGTLLLILPGIFIVVSMSMYWYTQIFENTGVSESLRRSRNLVKGYWWRTAFLLLCAGLGYLCVALVAVILITLISHHLGYSVAKSPLGITISIAFASIGLPLMYAINLVTFRDLQQRSGIARQETPPPIPVQ